MKLRMLSISSLFAVFVVLACGSDVLAGATLTPEPTITLVPTKTPPPKPTATLSPTPTAFPTPAPVGVPVSSDDYEATVLKAVRLERVAPANPDGIFPRRGGYISGIYRPKQGYMMIDVGVRVRNLHPGKTVSVQWNSIYIVDSGDRWYPYWANYVPVEAGYVVDPLTLAIPSNEVFKCPVSGCPSITRYVPYSLEPSSSTLIGNEPVVFDDAMYLRLIFVLEDDDPKSILFGFVDAPWIEIVVEK